jgi:hypothetical protein
VPSCAGVYVDGAAGSNECPAGSVRIATEAACRTAAAAAGMTIPRSTFVETSSEFPRGCYYYYRSYRRSHAASGSSNGPYFNADAAGAGNADTRLLCAADTMSAPPPQRCRCARACLHRRATAARRRCARACLHRRATAARRRCARACLHRRACVPALRVCCALCITKQTAYI